MIRLLLACVTPICLAGRVASDCNCITGCVGNPSGRCSSCKAGWYGPYCQKKNVALNGTATQQGSYRDSRSSYPARLAVDGNTSNTLYQGRCAHTDSRENAWWRVKLENNGVNQIKYMKIYNREDEYKNIYRRKGMKILIDGKECKTWGNDSFPKTIEDVACGDTLTGHNLTITVLSEYLTLCEVQVFVCSDGWFGEDCDQKCNCVNPSDTCDKVTGGCDQGCRAGYHGDDCLTPCRDGIYGVDCSARCGHCVNNTACDKTTGHCPCVCADGWDGRKCDVCRERRYGQDCTSTCHCVCNKTTGDCLDVCDDGWDGRNCDVCTDGRYGLDCSSVCGHCANNQPCNKTTGLCGAGCEDGWEQERCDRELPPRNTDQPSADSSTQSPGPPVVVAAVGTGLVVLLLVVGIHLCLLRQGRVQWVRRSTGEPVQESRDSVQMNNIAHSGSRIEGNHYEDLNAETLASASETTYGMYGVIQHDVYQNI